MQTDIPRLGPRGYLSTATPMLLAVCASAISYATGDGTSLIIVLVKGMVHVKQF